MLTPENYDRGFLITDELMAGVSAAPSGYLAYIIQVETGEHVGARVFPELAPALALVNGTPAPWRYEATGGCGSRDCGKPGPDGQGPHCATGACGKPCETTGACAF